MSWRIAESLKKLREQINAAYPNRSKVSDGAIGDAAHATRNSDHNPWVKDSRSVGIVTAIDITHDPKVLDCNQLAETLLESRDPRIKYVIWNKRIASKAKGWKWRPYSGINAHQHHLHISVEPAPNFYDSRAEWDLDIAKTVPNTFSNLKDEEIKLDIPVKNYSASDASSKSDAISAPMSDKNGADELNDGGGASDSNASKPQVADNINNFNAGEQLPKPDEVLPGTKPTDDAQAVSQAKLPSRIYTILGTVAGGLTALKGFVSDNQFLIGIGIVCITLLFLAMIFRGVILDWLRMQLFSDPKRYNVK